MRANTVRFIVFLGVATLGGCGSQTGYEKAFSQQSALSGNSQEFDAAADQTFRTVKVTLVQQGFTVEQVDVGTGLIKAVRSLQDPKKSDYAYLITTTVDITGQPSGKSTTVTIAASQQTVLHKDSEKYFHLLGLVPIPSGRVHQTVVTKEGNIDKAAFYSDFFAAVHKNLRLAAVAAASNPPTGTASALPESGADAARTFPVENGASPTGAPPAAEPTAGAPIAAAPASAIAPAAAAGSAQPGSTADAAPRGANTAMPTAPLPASAPNSAVLAPLDP
jgi:hypothetical protein